VVEAHAEAAEHGGHAEIVRRQALGHFEGEAGEGVRTPFGAPSDKDARDHHALDEEQRVVLVERAVVVVARAAAGGHAREHRSDVQKLRVVQRLRGTQHLRRLLEHFGRRALREEGVLELIDDHLAP